MLRPARCPKVELLVSVYSLRISYLNFSSDFGTHETQRYQKKIARINKTAVISRILVSYMLLLATGCANLEPSQSYLRAQQIGDYATSADLWLLKNPVSNGFLPGLYDPERDRFTTKTNTSSQLYAARRLTELAITQTRFIQPADAIAEAIIREWHVDTIGLSMIAVKNKSSLGDNALWLRVQVAQFANTRDENLALRIHELAKRIMQNFHPEKGFPQRINPQETTSAYYQRLYSAQAALALLEYSAEFEDPESQGVAGAALDWLKRRYPFNDADLFHPTLSSWHALAIAQQFNLTGDTTNLPILFLTAKQLVKLQSDSDFPGQFMTPKGKKYGQPNAVRDALAALALLESLHIAAQQNLPVAKKYRRAIWLSLTNLRSLQYDYGTVNAFPQPHAAVGAIRLRHNKAMVRLDATVLGAEVFERAATLIRAGIL